MGRVMAIILIVFCFGLTVYQIYGTVSDMRKRRKLKKEHPEAEEKEKDDEE